jgi:RNA polymerase sigma factor (sigma-70 family)
MSEWPATRVTLLERLRDPQDREAWAEFVALYGPLIYEFARRRLPQDEDAADVMQEVLSAVMGGRYQRPRGRFQKWVVTVLLNRIRDFHAAQARRCEVPVGPAANASRQEEPSRADEEEWEKDRQRHLFRAAADRVRARTNPVHWDVFVRTALQDQSGQQVSGALNVSLTNVYAIKSRLMKEIKDEIHRYGDDGDEA